MCTRKSHRMLLISVMVLLIGVVLTPLLACGSGTAHHTYWFTDPPGTFHTNDLERAQKEIPFTIVLPIYLPNDLQPYPRLIEGPIKGTKPDDEIEINIQYQEKIGGAYLVIISEINDTINVYPSDPESKYHDIDGIRVLEEKGNVLELPSGTYIPILRFFWNRDGVHYDVQVERYGQDEALKIVESMIQPIE